jgi:hypothetical protein
MPETAGSWNRLGRKKIIIGAYLCSYTKVIDKTLVCITYSGVPNTKSLKSLCFKFFILYNDQHMHN